MPSPPNKIQSEHSATLANIIRERIEKNRGWISFEQFMGLALYAPGLGYYSAGANKIGVHGDFITAPLLGRQFAGCLARQCDEIIENLAAVQPITVAEFGAGTGQFALDFLIDMDSLNQLPDQYLIIETSADLQQRQKKLIETNGRQYLDIIKWLDAIPESGINGVIIANELLDALPVMRFQIDGSGQAKELGVAMRDNRFVWQVSTDSIPEVLQQRLNQYSLPPGYQSEIGTQAEGWVRTIGEKLISGVMILIDYGFPQAEFYHRDRAQGTLMCHYQHIAHDNPFYFTGIQDMTSHVDFSAITAAGQDAGLQVIGYCGQGGFLLSLGLLENFQDIKNNATQNNIAGNRQSILHAHTLTQEIKKLTLPHQMGELFKVIALAKNYPARLSGFTMQDHSGRL